MIPADRVIIGRDNDRQQGKGARRGRQPEANGSDLRGINGKSIITIRRANLEIGAVMSIEIMGW